MKKKNEDKGKGIAITHYYLVNGKNAAHRI